MDIERYLFTAKKILSQNIAHTCLHKNTSLHFANNTSCLHAI